MDPRHLPSSASPSAEVSGHVAAFCDVAQAAPDNTVRAALTALGVAGKDKETAAFVTRSINAVIRIAKVSPRVRLLEAAGAESDMLVLLEALDDPATLSELGEGEQHRAELRIRGLRAQQRLVDAEGGVCSATQLGELLRLSRQAIDKRRKAGKLIALDLGRHGYRYPIWQFHDGSVLPGLEKVIGELGECDPWTQVSFMLSPNAWLGDDTPLAALRRGEVDRVVATAEMFDY